MAHPHSPQPRHHRHPAAPAHGLAPVIAFTPLCTHLYPQNKEPLTQETVRKEFNEKTGQTADQAWGIARHTGWSAQNLHTTSPFVVHTPQISHSYSSPNHLNISLFPPLIPPPQILWDAKLLFPCITGGALPLCSNFLSPKSAAPMVTDFTPGHWGWALLRASLKRGPDRWWFLRTPQFRSNPTCHCASLALWVCASGPKVGWWLLGWAWQQLGRVLFGLPPLIFSLNLYHIPDSTQMHCSSKTAVAILDSSSTEASEVFECGQFLMWILAGTQNILLLLQNSEWE